MFSFESQACVSHPGAAFSNTAARIFQKTKMKAMVLKIEALHKTHASVQVSVAWCGGRPWDLKAQALDSEKAKRTSTGHDFPKAKWLVETASLIQTRLSKAIT